MKVECLQQGGGKTYKAIEYAHDNDCYILVFSKKEAERVYESAQEMGKPIRMPITLLDEYKGGKPVVVDNADFILSILLSQKDINCIPMITITHPNLLRNNKDLLKGEV